MEHLFQETEDILRLLKGEAGVRMPGLEVAEAAVWCDEGDTAAATAWLEAHLEDRAGAAALLHCAAQRGQAEVVGLVLAQGGLEVDVPAEGSGDTALHLAARRGHHEVVQCLLRAGASLGARNKEGQTPMSMMGNIPADILEEVLDDCIEGKREGGDFVLTLRFPFLTTTKKEAGLTSVVSKKEEGENSSKESEVVNMTALPAAEETAVQGALPETPPLLWMAQSMEHIHLLEHPIITSFLHMKWKSIELFFFVKLMCCIIFTSLLNAYIFLLNENIGSGQPETTREAALKWITFVCLVLFTIRELMLNWHPLIKELLNNIQNILAKGEKDYASVQKTFAPLVTQIKILENWLRLILIISTYLLIFLPASKPYTALPPAPANTKEFQETVTLVKHLSAFTVLLSWVYTLFFWALHPWFAVYSAMVTTISRNFFKILVWLFWFVFAFALTFFFLFRSTETDEDGNLINESFATTREAIIKTIVMVFTGELDFGALVFSAPFGKFIFVLFVFFIMLVLMNLLNGLAITDIAVIQKESEINTQIARMVTIASYEDVWLIDSTFFRKYGGFFLVSDKLKKNEAEFKLHGKSWQGISPENFNLIPKPMLDAAKALVVNKSLADAEEKSKEAATDNVPLKAVTERLRKIELTLEKISAKLTELT